MPRFVGKKSYGVWWDITAVVILIVVILVVLDLTNVLDIFRIID